MNKRYRLVDEDWVISLHRLAKAASALILIIIIATIGYMFLEGWGFLDAIYMTIITVSTVGYREVNPLSAGGRIFSLFVILFGVGMLFYTLASAVEVMVEGQIKELFGRRRMQKQIGKLKDHFILCGYGRVGKEIAKALTRNKAEFVVIEVNKDRIEDALEEGHIAIRGSASEDEILMGAGITKAKGLLTTLTSDAQNVFVTLSAKTLNPNIFIVARAEEEESERKLYQAGADRVISPYSIGGRRMASLLLKPLVSDFLDTVTHGHKLEFELEELRITEGSPLIGKTIGEARIRDVTGALILAIHRDGQIDTSPPATTRIQDNDMLLAIGTTKQLEEFAKYAKIEEKEQ